MGKVLTVSCVAALLFSHAAGADVLKLAGGGELPGTIEEVLFLSEGKERRIPAADVVSILISPVARDVIELKDNVKLTGEFISLTFKSLGGVLTFKRKELSEVVIGTPTAEPPPKTDPGTGGDVPQPPVRDKPPVVPPPDPKEPPKIDAEKAAALKEALAKNEELRKKYHEIVNKELEETKKQIEEKWKTRTPGVWVRLDPTADVRDRDEDFLTVYVRDLTLADIQERILYLKARLRWVADKLVLRTRDEVNRREEYRREQDRLERELRLANEKLGKIQVAIRNDLGNAAKAAGLKKTALNVVHDRQRYSMVHDGKLFTADELEAGYRNVVEKDDKVIGE